MNGGSVRFLLLFVGALLFWIVTSAWLVHEEILPYFRGWEIGSYRTVVPADRQPRMAVYEFTVPGGRRAGRAESLSRPLADGRWKIETRMRLQMGAILPAAQGAGETEMSSWVELDPTMHLDRFETTTQVGALPVAVRGRRVDNQLEVTIELLGEPIRKWVRFDPDWTLSEEFAPLAGARGIAVGQRWLRKTLEFNFQHGEFEFDNEYVSVEEEEVIEHAGHAALTYRVEFRRRPTDVAPKSRAWVTQEGEVLAHEISVGTQTLRGELQARWVPSPAQVGAWERGERVAPPGEDP